MKILIIFTLLLTLNFGAFSQTTTNFLRDTISQNRVKFTVSLQGSLSDLENVRILLFQHTESDTLLVLESVYSLTENDPSSFYSLKKSESGFEFGLGIYEMEAYRCKLYLKRENNIEEEITLN